MSITIPFSLPDSTELVFNQPQSNANIAPHQPSNQQPLTDQHSEQIQPAGPPPVASLTTLLPLPMFSLTSEMPDTFTMNPFDYPLLSPYSASESNHSMSDHCLFDKMNAEATAEPSPNQLQCSTQEAEQSFIYGAAPDGSIQPIKMSQDYDDESSIFDEVNQITENGFYYPTGTPSKPLDHVMPGALSYDHIYTETPVEPMDSRNSTLSDDLALETVSHVMLNVFTFNQSNQNNSNSYKVIYTQPESTEELDYCELLTPAASPQSPPCTKYLEDTYEDIANVYSNEQNQGNIVKSEHNYTTPSAKTKSRHTGRNHLSCKRKLQLDQGLDKYTDQIRVVDTVSESFNQTAAADTDDMRHPQVPPLKLKMHPAVLRQCEPFALNTPEISNNNTLDLETDTMEFDLIDFINSPQVCKNFFYFLLI